MKKQASPTTLGQRIRQRRDALGLSRRALSIVLDCDPQTIYGWELDKREPSLATLRRIAEALGVKAWELMA